MMAKSSRDDAYEISDSTDWLSTPLNHFSNVESALRCQVCKDFFTTPMITSCSHTFCSLCIRRCLSNDGKCPACRAPEQELKLRSNGVVEAVVEAFQRARPLALDYARGHSEIAATSFPKRKLGAQGDDEQPNKRTRSSIRIAISQKESSGVAVADMELDDNFRPKEDDGLVACPICGSRMKIESINSHLDRCNTEALKQPSKSPTTESPRSRKFTKRPERLPHLSYSLFNDKALRKKLQELGISAAGSKLLLERRHTEWVTLWNANCDSSKPRRKTELLRDLDIWERTQGGWAPVGNALSMGTEIRSKEFDGAGWSTKYDDSFHTLIASARRKVAPKGNLQSSKPENGTGTPGSGDKSISDAISMQTSEERLPYDTQTVENHAPSSLQLQQLAAEDSNLVPPPYIPTQSNVDNGKTDDSAMSTNFTPESNSAREKPSPRNDSFQGSSRYHGSDMISMSDEA